MFWCIGGMGINMKWYVSFILIGILLTMTACSESPDNRAINNADSSLPAQSVFYRIQASYEVIETGEAIDFDYTVSCYNQDTPGSFQGIIWPKTIFAATKTGQALAIAVPDYYCSRQVRGDALVQEDDLWKMPHLAWYPNVNDLSFAFVYASNDAYTGPKAKVRFKSYEATPSTRDHFESWYAATEAEYEQIGAIPGPFGCTNFNVSSGKDPEACGHESNKRLNNDKIFALPLESSHFVRILKWPDGYTRAARDYLGVNDARYRCMKCISPETDAPYETTITQWINVTKRIRTPEKISELAQKIRWLEMESEEVYLDPQLLLTGEGKRPIREVFPVVFHHARPLMKKDIKSGEGPSITQIIRQPEWRGFGINTREIGNYMPEFPRPEYNGLDTSVAFINETIINAGRGSPIMPRLYDLELGQTLSAENTRPDMTNW